MQYDGNQIDIYKVFRVITINTNRIELDNTIQ